MFSSLIIQKEKDAATTISSLKGLITLQMQNSKSDIVIVNDGAKNGVTDITFEKRDSKHGSMRVISLYFMMDQEGIESYRTVASKVYNNPAVELSFTPHFGQSRISIEWDAFWEMVRCQRDNSSSSGVLSRIPALLSSSSIK